ncbi:hypothetical protein Q7689_30420, partial [Nocardiopsis tropica]|nr:hypothetical protein [Nocardiopsis tropica]
PEDAEADRAEAPGPATGTPPGDRTERGPEAHPAAGSPLDTFHSALNTQTPPVRSGPVTGEESSGPGDGPSPRPVPAPSAPESNTDDGTTEAAPAETGVSRGQATPPDPLTTGTGKTTEEAVRPPAPPEAETRVPTEEARTRTEDGGHEEGAPPPSQQHEHDTTAGPAETVDTTGTVETADPVDTPDTTGTEQPLPPQQEDTDLTTDTRNTTPPADTEQPPPPPPPQENTDTTVGTDTERPQPDTGDTRPREEPAPRNYPGSVRPDRTGAPYDLGYLLTSNLVNSSMVHAEHLRSFVDDTLANDAGHVDATVRDAVREQVDAQARKQTGVFFGPEGFSTTVTGADGST